MKIHAKKCGETQGEFLGPENECWNRVGGNLDIETRCMQEGVVRNGGTCRY